MQTTAQKEVLTTGEVARICHVAPRTVSKWFDTGKLRGYRIPGSRDRRIPLSHLLAFMRVHGIPLDGLDGGTCRVVLLGGAEMAECARILQGSNRLEVRTAGNGFEAGVIAQQFRPHVVVLDVTSGQETEAQAICHNIKSNSELASAKVIAAVGMPSQPAEWFSSVGFDGVLGKPFSPAQLLGAVQKATDLIS